MPGITYVNAGTYLSQIANSEATIAFAAQDLLRVEVIQTTTRVIGEEFLSSPMSLVSQVVDGDGKSFHNTLNSVSGAGFYQLMVHGVCDDTAGVEELRLRPSLEMGATLKADYGFHCADIVLRIPVIGDLADCRVVIADAEFNSMSVQLWSAMPTSEANGKLAYPFAPAKGGEAGASPENPSGDSGTVANDEPSGTTSSNVTSLFDMMAVYNEVTGEICVFRTNDIRGRGKIRSVFRNVDDNSLVLTCRFIPQAFANGNNGDSDEDFDYSLCVKPMLSPVPKTAWQDAAQYWKDRAEAEGHPYTLNDRIIDRPSSGAGYFPDKARNAVAFAAHTGGNDVEGFTPSLGLLNALAIQDAFEIPSGQMLYQWYNYHPGPIGRDKPTILFDTGQAAAMMAAHDAGIPVIPYNIQLELGVWDGSTGLPEYFDINDDLATDRDGNVLIGESPIVGADDGGAIYPAPTFEDDAATVELIDYQADGFIAGLGTKFDGLYDDVTLKPSSDDNPARAAAVRGWGAGGWQQKNRDRLDFLAARLAAKGITAPVIIGEHAHPEVAGHAHVLLDIGVDPRMTNYLTSIIPMANIALGPWVVLSNPSSPGGGPITGIVSAVSGWAAKCEVLAWIQADHICRGHIPSFWKFFGNSLDTYFDATTTDSEVTAWQNWLKDVWFNQAAIIRHYQRCDRQRELSGSHIIKLIDAKLSDDPASMVWSGGKLLSFNAHDRDRDCLGIYVVNWSMTGYNPATVTLDETFVRAHRPALGAGARDVYVLDTKTLDRFKLKPWAAGEDYVFDFDVAPGKSYVIEMPLSGEAPFAGELTTGFIDVAGDYSPFIDLVGGIMTAENQSGSTRQGAAKTLRMTIPIGSSGLTADDVTDATVALTREGVAVVTKTFGVMTVAVVGTDIVITAPLLASEIDDLYGIYPYEWSATMDGVDDIRSAGIIEIKKSVLL